MDENSQDAPLEVMAPSAIMAMEKAQIDMQIATAHQYPRSLELFKKRALSMACLDPETADSCIYVRPVGKENGKPKYAEGPSIRLAEIVAVSYGNLRAASKVVEQTDRYVKCTGMAHDLESNCAMSADVIESTVTKDGHPYSERQRALIAKVCGAKALRDSIFKVVPRALCKPIMEAAKKVSAGQDKSLDERRKKAQAWIGTLKIDERRVFAVLDVSGWTDVTAEHLTILTGLRTAMADNDETIESAFPPVQTDDKTKPAQTAHEKATKGSKAEPSRAPQTSQDKPKPTEATSTPPATETPSSQPAAIEAKAPEQTSAPDPAKSVTETGPKPETTGEKPQDDDNVIFESVPAPASQETPGFVPNPQETVELQQVRRLLHSHNKTEADLISVLRKNKAMKDEQTKISELSTKKLENIAAHWEGLMKLMGA